MQIFLVRHGDPDYVQDRLTDRGIEQAGRLAVYMDSLPLDAICTSPLGRARETGSFVAERQQLEPVTMEWLTDFSVDVDILAPGGDWHLPGGIMSPEAFEQSERLKKGFDEVLAGYGYIREGRVYRVERSSAAQIAFFCHKAVAQTLISHALNWLQPGIYAALEVSPASLSTLVTLEQNGFAGFQALVLNSVAHLE